jgi:hypothetical protein
MADEQEQQAEVHVAAAVEVGDQTDDADVNKAVDDLQKAVTNVRDAVKNGDETPDISPVTDAAGELTKVCTP